ncbi:hypothetical protein VTO42DRAFT_3691 [Malbranchea cinnamomea]
MRREQMPVTRPWISSRHHTRIGLFRLYLGRMLLKIRSGFGACCFKYKLGKPEYTHYMHGDRLQCEVDVAGSQFFSVGKSYGTVTEAVHATAHNALHCLLLGSVNDIAPCPEVMLRISAATESCESLMMQHALYALTKAWKSPVATRDVAHYSSAQCAAAPTTGATLLNGSRN